MNSGTPTININIQQPAQPAPPVAQPFPVPYQPLVQPFPIPVVQQVPVQVVQPVQIPVYQPVESPPPLDKVPRPQTEPPCCPFTCCCF